MPLPRRTVSSSSPMKKRADSGRSGVNRGVEGKPRGTPPEGAWGSLLGRASQHQLHPVCWNTILGPHLPSRLFSGKLHFQFAQIPAARFVTKRRYQEQ